MENIVTQDYCNNWNNTCLNTLSAFFFMLFSIPGQDIQKNYFDYG